MASRDDSVATLLNLDKRMREANVLPIPTTGSNEEEAKADWEHAGADDEEEESFTLDNI